MDIIVAMAEEFISLGKNVPKTNSKTVAKKGISATSDKKFWDPQKSERDARTLHISFKKVKKLPDREIIRRLHTNIVDVKFPRQKSAKFCYLVFDNAAQADEAKAGLENNQGSYTFSVNRIGPKTQRYPPTEKPTPDNVFDSCRLVVSGYPEFAAEALLKAAFPNVKSITFPTINGIKQNRAFIEFDSPDVTREALNNSKSLSVNGTPIIVKPAPPANQDAAQKSVTIKRKNAEGSTLKKTKRTRTA